MRRGDVVTAVLPGTYGKPRPALVLQDNRFIEQASIIVAPFSSHLLDASEFRLRIEPDAANGLRLTCDLMLDKLAAIPRDKVGLPIGTLPERLMRRINRALILFLGLAADPPPPAS